MKLLNALDPARMTREERLREVSSILALGLIRMRTPPDNKPPESGQTELDFPLPPRVHSNRASRVQSSIREALLAKQNGVKP